MRVTYKGNDLSRDDLVFQMGVLESARVTIDKVLKNCSYDMYEKLLAADKLLIEVIHANKKEI